MPKTKESLLWDRLFSYVNGGLGDHGELSWQYCDLDIWPIVKAQILTRGSNIFNAGRSMSVICGETPTVSAAPHKVTPAVGRQKTSMPIGSFEWPELPFPPDGTDVLCLGYATNHKKLGTSHFQLCLDPLRVALAESGHPSICLVAGLANSDEAIVQAAAKDTYGISAQFWKVRKLDKHLPAVDLAACPGFSVFWNGLSEVLGAQTFITIDHIETIIKRTAIVAAWFHDYLSRTRPRLVLVSAYYGLIGHGASWACRRLGIPIADVQHGAAGSSHHAYSWPNALRGGFNTLPTGFLTWSDVECSDMRRTSGSWAPALFEVGNVWRLLDETLAHGNGRSIFKPGAIAAAQMELRSDFGAISEIQAANSSGKDILVAFHPEEKVGWFPVLRQIAPSNWRFWVRLHPGDLENAELLELADERTFVLEATRAPLNVMLDSVDAVLAKYSSVMLDGRAFGVPSVAYSEAAKAIFGKSEKYKIRYTLPRPRMIQAALMQRMSIYAAGTNQRQQIMPFDVLGRMVFDGLCSSADADRPEAKPSNGASDSCLGAKEPE